MGLDTFAANNVIPSSRRSPFFSVIIPAFNAEDTALRSLESVARQDYSDFEIILVDDGSTDATALRVRDWAECHPNVGFRIIAQRNRGPAAARNTAIREATGEYAEMGIELLKPMYDRYRHDRYFPEPVVSEDVINEIFTKMK